MGMDAQYTVIPDINSTTHIYMYCGCIATVYDVSKSSAL